MRRTKPGLNISAMFTENIKFPPKEKQFEGEPWASLRVLLWRRRMMKCFINNIQTVSCQYLCQISSKCWAWKYQVSQSLDTFVILKYLEISYIFIFNNLKLDEFNFSLHVELELEVSTLDKFNYHQCQFLTLNSQIGCFYYQGGREGGRESIIHSGFYSKKR